MTFKDLASKLNNSVQTVPNLIQVLKDGFQNVEAGGSAGKSYSTTEFDTGEKWTDGKTIYGKVISNINIPANAYTEEVDIGSLVNVIKVESLDVSTSSGLSFQLADIYCKVVNGTTTKVYPTTTVGTFTDATICVYYTKG